MVFKTIAIDHSATSPSRLFRSFAACTPLSIAFFPEEKDQPNSEGQDRHEPPEISELTSGQFHES